MSKRGKWLQTEEVVIPSGAAVLTVRRPSCAGAAAVERLTWQARQQRANRYGSSSVRTSGGRRCTHSQAFQLLSSYTGCHVVSVNVVSDGFEPCACYCYGPIRFAEI